MAQKVQVLLVDDVDGGTADETVTFGLDGVTYEIDLTSDNAAKLRDAFAQWVANARKVSGRSSGRSAGRSTSSSTRSARSNEAQEVREWAKANGYQVSERGRISAEVKKAYDDAH
ncbi:histone-like nucleoid-structuring protein Lsr2 [Cellulomonas phragmiteti]|uniref:Lsr2 family protein n=1 Tax=Cellulomonas phragmiteti TaxID=478780 RepID=A0ABQ4DRJ6_9CELL|nr:Lsr2 family protein [Cellulomonas phragmiteti]GIG41541.1 Lsr2 family protein [Cellulomonas phragmiteti]